MPLVIGSFLSRKNNKNVRSFQFEVENLSHNKEKLMAKSTTKTSSISMIALAPDSALVAIRRLVDTNLALAKRNAKRQGIMLWGPAGCR